MNTFKPKILFVIQDNYEYERIGLQILSAIALQEGFERNPLILNSVSIEDALKMAQEFKPNVVAYSAMTFEETELQRYNKFLKNSGLKFISVFGGPHYTFNPEEIYNDVNIDILCRG